MLPHDFTNQILSDAQIIGCADMPLLPLRGRWETISAVTSKDIHTLCLTCVGWSVDTNSRVNDSVYSVWLHFLMSV